MKRIVYHLKSATRAVEASERLLELPCDGSVDVVFKNHESTRSLAQNRLSFQWYDELGEQSGNGKDHERNFCKWTYGFPVLLARENVDPEIHRMWEILTAVPYEQRIEAMEMVEVTRLFKTKEFAEYLRSLERYAGDMGYHLTRPDDIYWEAMGYTQRKKR